MTDARLLQMILSADRMVAVDSSSLLLCVNKTRQLMRPPGRMPTLVVKFKNV